MKLKFHGTDTDTDILADFRARIVATREDVGVSGDFPIQLATSRTRTTILADLSDTPRDFPREDITR